MEALDDARIINVNLRSSLFGCINVPTISSWPRDVLTHIPSVRKSSGHQVKCCVRINRTCIYWSSGEEARTYQVMEKTCQVSGASPNVQTKEVEEHILKLRRSCAGKKGSITKRIDQLTGLVSEGGSRMKIKFLSAALLEVHKATIGVFQKMASLMKDPDEEWMEEINFRVDTCVTEVQEYIAAREGDTNSSKASITESWIMSYNPRPDSVRFEETIPTHRH